MINVEAVLGLCGLGVIVGGLGILVAYGIHAIITGRYHG